MTSDQKSSSAQTASRQPAIFLSHGGGPCFFMEARDGPLAAVDKNSSSAAFFRGFAKKFLKTPPKSILVVSAHWLTSSYEVTSGKKTSLFYDYYGFPAETYELEYPAPGDPKLSERVMELVKAQKWQIAGNAKRGLDHGVFLPLKLIYPDADIPVVQLSMLSNLDPKDHVELGKALAPLRDEGVLIVCSGQATHNMRALMSSGSKPGTKEVKFTNWLSETLRKSESERNELLIDFRKSAPEADNAHPRGAHEHLLPLHVAAGAAGSDEGKTVWNHIAGEHFALHTFLFG